MVAKASFYVPTSRGPKGHRCWYLKTNFLELLQLKSSLKYFRKYFFWNYFNLTSVSMIPSHMRIRWLAVRPHSACSQSQIPRCTSQEHLHQRVPNIQGQHHGSVCFTHSLCFIPVIFITNISTPRIHKLLKLLQLNLSDAITQAHSTTFPHGLAIIRSILFRDYFTRVLKNTRLSP